jgi:hypothetical protein
MTPACFLGTEENKKMESPIDKGVNSEFMEFISIEWVLTILIKN